MAHKPDVPCAGCGKLLWRGPGSLPDGKRLCRDCRRKPLTARAVPPPEPVDVKLTTEPSDRFGPRGARLWRDATADPDLTLSPAEVVLLEEACRLADRLDRLDDFLTGRGDVWLRFHARNEDGSVVRVVVDRALSEARQQADTLRGIVADLVKRQGAKASEEPEASGFDEITRRREERRRAAGL
jgi:hypothetical protein